MLLISINGILPGNKHLTFNIELTLLFKTSSHTFGRLATFSAPSLSFTISYPVLKGFSTTVPGSLNKYYEQEQ